MAQNPDNLDANQETEARLCAYLEDELTPAERAEIEKFLQSSPQHRQLLRELAQMRNLVGALPRESAPPEIAEAFQGQLERAMLLDEDSSAAVRGNLWPQRLALAAVLLLAVGLGVVIYLELPGTQMSAQKYAANNAPPANAAPSPAVAAAPQLSELSNSSAPRDEPAKPAGIGGGFGGGGGMKQTENSAEFSMAKALPTETQQQEINQDSVAGKMSMQAATPQQLALANGLSPQKTVYVTVSTNNLAAADGQVRSFFQSNAIPFQAIVQPTPPANRAQGQSQVANSINLGTENQVSPMVLTDQRQLRQAIVDVNGEHLYFVRNLPRQTAQQLKAALDTDRTGQTAVMTGFAATGLFDNKTAANSLPATQPTTQPAVIFKPDDSLTVTVDQLVGPGVEKTNTVRVAGDGTVSLPMIEPVPASGSTAAELEKRIADKYREANLIPDAKVTVAMPAPATQPLAATTEPAATQPAVATATTEPTTLPTAQTAATTQPDTTDLVVVLRNISAATTAPTTQQ